MGEVVQAALLVEGSFHLVATQFACKPDIAAIVIKTELHISFLKSPFSSDLESLSEEIYLSVFPRENERCG